MNIKNQLSNSLKLKQALKKELTNEALNLNGGVDAHRFELFKKYLFDLLTPETAKICSMIEKLELVA